MTDSTHHVVVLDCNIILNLAQHFGGAFTSEEVNRLLSAHRSETTVREPVRNAARAFTLAIRGQTFAGQPMSFVTSRHILDTVIHKATQPQCGTRQEQRGLGLDRDTAQRIAALVEGLSKDSFRRVIEPNEQVAEKTPPLDHEDGMVYGLCRLLSGMDSRFHVWCVTFDREFIDHARTFDRSHCISVVLPGEFVSRHQSQVVAAMLSAGSGGGEAR